MGVHQNENIEPIKPSEPVNFLTQAYSNYKSARVLLNKGSIVDAHIMAQYAVEKYMKGLLLIKGQRFFGHVLSKPDWLNDFHKQFPELRESLTKEFLEYLGNAFRLRYWDNQREIGNVILFRRKMLFYLDQAVSTIEANMLKRPPDTQATYHWDLESQNPDLLDNNAVLNSDAKFDKESYEEDIMAFVLDENLNLMEIQATLKDHKYSMGFPSPGHLKFTSTDEGKKEYIFPSRTYPKNKVLK